MATQLKSKPGLSSTTALSIPKDWDPTWFRHFINNQLKGADVRNAIGAGGISISGSIASPYATISASGLISSVVGTANEIVVSTTGGVATLSFAPNVVIPEAPSGVTLVVGNSTNGREVASIGVVNVSVGQVFSSGSGEIWTNGQDLNIGTVGAQALNLWTNDTERVTISSSGATTFLAASGQNTVTINSASGVNAIVLSAGGSNGTGGILQEAIGVPTIVMNSSGAHFGEIGDQGTQVWYLGHGASPTANGTSVLTWNASGQVAINSPGSAVTPFTVTQNNAATTALFNGTNPECIRLASTAANGSYMQWYNGSTFLGYMGAAAQQFTGGAIGDMAIGCNTAQQLVLGVFTTPIFTISNAGTFAAQIQTASSGPWALQINRTDVGSILHVFNAATTSGNGYWYFSEGVASQGKILLRSNDAAVGSAPGGLVSSQAGGTASGGSPGDIILIY